MRPALGAPAPNPGSEQRTRIQIWMRVGVVRGKKGLDELKVELIALRGSRPSSKLRTPPQTGDVRPDLGAPRRLGAALCSDYCS